MSFSITYIEALFLFCRQMLIGVYRSPHPAEGWARHSPEGTPLSFVPEVGVMVPGDWKWDESNTAKRGRMDRNAAVKFKTLCTLGKCRQQPMCRTCNPPPHL